MSDKRAPRAGDRVRVKATGETGTLITTAQYNALTRGQLEPRRWTHTRWVRFDDGTWPPRVVGHSPSEVEWAAASGWTAVQPPTGNVPPSERITVTDTDRELLE